MHQYLCFITYSHQVDGFRNPMKNELKTTACLEIISNTDANFRNLHIDKARKAYDDKKLCWQQMTDNFQNKFIYLLTLKVTMQLLKSPKDSKLQFSFFSLITTVSCAESTMLVYGSGPKIGEVRMEKDCARVLRIQDQCFFLKWEKWYERKDMA